MNEVNMDTEKYLILYANCLPVLGASRSCIYDLQKGKIEFIPNFVVDVLKELRDQTIAQVLNAYDEESQQMIMDEIQLIVEKQFGFLGDADERSWFVDMDLSWDSPSFIENAIIDIDEKSQHDYSEIFAELSALGCQAIQFRFYTEVSFMTLQTIFAKLENSRITGIDLLLPYTEECNEENFGVLVTQATRIFKITVHSVPKHLEIPKMHLPCICIFSNQIVDSSAHCGFISPQYFKINIKTFTESQKHNTCLNRKISIDTESNIKNCPAMEKSYGKAGKIKLSEVIKDESFTQLWYVHKDQVKTCMDCEFRYMCSDCRVFLKDENDPLSKPAKCAYDPYTMTWA